MLDQAVAIYCISDELLKTLNIRDDIQCKMSTAEVIRGKNRKRFLH